MTDNNRQYYISSGELTRMYTLRVRFEELAYARGEGGKPVAYTVVRDWYITNLATEPCRAKAAAERHMEGRTDGRLFDGELESLDAIRRRTSAEVEAARLASEYAAQQAQDEREAAYRASKMEYIEYGQWPFGQFKGERFENANDGYVVYFLGLDAEDDAVLETLQNALRAQFGHLANLPTPNGEYFGEPKKREDITATLIASFGFQGYYGFVHIQRFIAESGALLVYKGSAPVAADMGKPVTFKATVKSHDEYEGEAQTMIQRVKVAA